MYNGYPNFYTNQNNMIKEEATSPEEQEIVRKHIMKISEM